MNESGGGAVAAAQVPQPVPQPAPAPGDPATPGGEATTVSEAVPPRCETRTRMYRDGRVRAEGFPAEDIAGLLDGSPDAVVWLDLHDPDETDLQVLVHEFGLHPLAVEDAVHDHQRPKLDRYDSHLFLNAYAVAFEPDPARLRTSEVSAFVTPRALITVRKADFDVDALLRRWDASPELATGGVTFLLHGLLDAVVDGHEQAAEALDDAVDRLEGQLFAQSRGGDIRRDGFELRKVTSELRRVVTPMRELTTRLLRGNLELLDARMAPYFEDVHDHVLRAVEEVETARDQIASVMETDFNEQGNELNVITRKLAAWAAIIAVPTAVTGFYGQNVPYPGFEHWWGFLVSTVVILALGGGLYVMLRRRGWL